MIKHLEQEVGEAQHDKMGRYGLVEGKLVNGRGVWQRKKAGQESEEDVDEYLYFASSKEWFIGDKEDMEAGKPRGKVHSHHF